MNAHHMMNSGAFGLSGLLLAQNHRSDVFSTLYDVWTCTWNYRNEMTGFSEKNSSGTVIDHISYGAFGSIRAETNPTSGSRFKFDGVRFDTITGLYNDRNRGIRLGQ